MVIYIRMYHPMGWEVKDNTNNIKTTVRTFILSKFILTMFYKYVNNYSRSQDFTQIKQHLIYCTFPDIHGPQFHKLLLLQQQVPLKVPDNVLHSLLEQVLLIFLLISETQHVQLSHKFFPKVAHSSLYGLVW